MRRIGLTLMALALLLVSAHSRPKPADRKARPNHARTEQRAKGAWDPGYTLYNPFGLPPWLRRPPQRPR
jgi:hypothetical protein